MDRTIIRIIVEGDEIVLAGSIRRILKKLVEAREKILSISIYFEQSK